MAVTPNQDFKKNVADIAHKLAIGSFKPSDILAVHRIPSKKDKTLLVLIVFSSAAVLETWINVRGKLGVLTQNNNLAQFYINESLSQINRNLFWKARTGGTERNFNFVWVRNGQIFAKRQEESTPVRITCKLGLEIIIKVGSQYRVLKNPIFFHLTKNCRSHHEAFFLSFM